MIKPSPEILAVANRWSKTIIHRDLDGLKNFEPDSAYLRIAGTSAGEFRSGKAVRTGAGAKYAEILSAMRCKTEEVEAFAFDNPGWCCFGIPVCSPIGRTRLTASRRSRTQAKYACLTSPA